MESARDDAVDLIDLDKLKNTTIRSVIEDYCRLNETSIQDIDSLENYYNVLKRLKTCFEDADFRTAGPLIRLGYVMLRIESEKLLLKYMDEDDRARFFASKPALYRMDVELAIQEAVLSLLSRHKDKILISEPSESGASAMGLGDLNRRRDTTDADLMNIVSDADKFDEIMAERIASEHYKKESISTTIVEDFDLPKIMDQLEGCMEGEDVVELQSLDMDYMDAFMAALHLSQEGKVMVIQKNFRSPILVRSL